MMKTHLSAHTTCPQCQSPLLRVPRSLAERYLSLLVPMARYRCVDVRCGWKGLLRHAGPSTREPRAASDYRPRTVLEASRSTPSSQGER